MAALYGAWCTHAAPGMRVVWCASCIACGTWPVAVLHAATLPTPFPTLWPNPLANSCAAHRLRSLRTPAPYAVVALGRGCCLRYPWLLRRLSEEDDPSDRQITHGFLKLVHETSHRRFSKAKYEQAVALMAGTAGAEEMTPAQAHSRAHQPHARTDESRRTRTNAHDHVQKHTHARAHAAVV